MYNANMFKKQQLSLFQQQLFHHLKYILLSHMKEFDFFPYRSDTECNTDREFRF